MRLSTKLKITAAVVLLYLLTMGFLYKTMLSPPTNYETARDVPSFQPSKPTMAVETPTTTISPSFDTTSTSVPAETTAVEPTTTTQPYDFRAPDTTISARPKVSFGSMHQCWVKDAKPVCTGQEYHGELGHNVAIPPIVDVQAGDGRTCALDVDGKVWCWGWKLSYGRSYDSISDAHQAVEVKLPDKATLLAVGKGQECAAVEVERGEQIWCWGFNYSQEYGFALPFYAAPDQPVMMWEGRHVHEIRAGHRWVEAHVGFSDGGCGWVHWGQYGGRSDSPVINRPERI